MRTYYHILNVSPRATDEQVRRAYHALARHWHPDRNPGGTQQAFVQISRAYSMLRTKPQRDAYNRYLVRKMKSREVKKTSRFTRLLIAMKEILWPFTLGREAPRG